MLGEVGSACGRHRYEGANAHSILLDNEPSRIGIFPDRKTRARSAPRPNDLKVWPRAWADPLQQIEYQRIDRIKHRKAAQLPTQRFYTSGVPEIQDSNARFSLNFVSRSFVYSDSHNRAGGVASGL